MISILSLVLLLSSTVTSQLVQSYSRIRLYEYTDYSDVIFLKFDIYGPTTRANWSIVLQRDGKCSDYPSNIHFDLQHQAYPLIAPKNESFPERYITTRHELVTRIFNQSLSNATVELTNPLEGTWFAMAFFESLSTESQSKISSNCNISLTTWLHYRAESVLLTLISNQALLIVLSNNVTFVYASYFTSTDNSRINVQSTWSSTCAISIRIRVNGLPSSSQYDYQIVCTNGSCSIELDQLTAFLWIYFHISIDRPSCPDDTVRGSIIINTTDCSSSCISTFSTQRVMSNSYYDFVYIPVNSNRSMNTIVLNESVIYAYEFLVDDRNIGGTIHLDFQSEMKSVSAWNTTARILVCLSKNRIRRYQTCEPDYQISIDQNSSTVRSLPYPEMALWYLTIEYRCTTSGNECSNASASLTFQISSSKCTREQCGTYGICQIDTSQQNIFSVCTCLAGYRGYGCTDSRYNYIWKYLPSVLFLTLSNLMFIPAIGLAIYYRLYIEALVYFFNMFVSTFYHACDQEIRQFCIFKYDGLQLSDFIASYSSIVITLITMSIISRSIKAFLFMLGVLTCIVLSSRDRFSDLQFIILMIIIFVFTVITWIITSIQKRRLQPSWKRLLFIVPGILFAATGFVLFVFIQNNDNYWYIHSLWHIFMAISILFFLPQRIKDQEGRRASNELVGMINEGTTVTENETDNHDQPTVTV